jgi:hypothetical protein
VHIPRPSLIYQESIRDPLDHSWPTVLMRVRGYRIERSRVRVVLEFRSQFASKVVPQRDLAPRRHHSVPRHPSTDHR